MATRYTFGDGDLAVRRIALVARIYEATSRAFLARAAPARPAVALDLGCGPGHTTRLLAEVCRPGRTLGLDASDRYLAAARTATDLDRGGIEYLRHDVTLVPFPEAPAGVIYARLVLAHLPEPLGIVERWRSQLAPGGVLLLEEVEAIEAPAGVLAEYEGLVTALVAAEGGTMAIGRALGVALGGGTVEVPVDVADAARMFGLNLATWGADAVRRALASAGEVERLGRELHEMAGRPPGTGIVGWVLRQVSAGPA